MQMQIAFVYLSKHVTQDTTIVVNNVTDKYRRVIMCDCNGEYTVYLLCGRLLHFSIGAIVVGPFTFFLGEGFHNLHRDVVL